MANIGIFGGSFNPPHRGHLLAAAEFQRRLGLDRVILMPAALPPHKALAAGSPDAHTRLELTRLAAQDLPFAEVSDLELHRSGASYTADTLEELHRQYPNDHLWFLMGTDMLLTFAQWHAPERIAKLASLAVAHRGRDDGKTLREAAQQLRDRFGADVVLVENDFLPYSSTIARAMLAFRCGEDYLEPAVYDAVCAQGLYHTRRDLRALPLDALARVALPLHDPKRVPHVLGCSHTAAELAWRIIRYVLVCFMLVSCYRVCSPTIRAYPSGRPCGCRSSARHRAAGSPPAGSHCSADTPPRDREAVGLPAPRRPRRPTCRPPQAAAAGSPCGGARTTPTRPAGRWRSTSG